MNYMRDISRADEGSLDESSLRLAFAFFNFIKATNPFTSDKRD